MPRRNSQNKEGNVKPKLKPGAKKQLVIMIISIVLMVFSVVQVYYLARYTFGFDVTQNEMKVYRWVYMLLEGNTAKK